MLFLGNEVYVDEIVMRLRNIFLSKPYQPDCNELRKVTFLLILNTDASFSRDLTEDFLICHLLNNFPQLSKCLFINLVWNLKLQMYFYEAIKYSPPWFMLQFLPEAIDSLRFSKPFEALTQVQELVEAIYSNICRMDYKIVNADQRVEQKIILNKLLEHIMSLLRNYNTPNADDEISRSKKKLKEYLGRSLNTQLSLIHKCFAMFQRKPQFELQEELNIYKLMIAKEPEFDNNSMNYSVVVQESLSKINIALLNTLQNSVVNITLDDFMFWIEIDVDDPSTEDKDLKRNNLQTSVGELSYGLIKFINGNGDFEHNVVKQLETISIKPKTLVEIAKEATVGTVLDRIESSPNKRVWLDELLDRPDTLYFNTECLQTIIDNISMLQYKDLMRILTDHQHYGSMDREDEIQVKEIFRLGGERLNNLETRDFVEELIRVFGVDYDLLHDDEDAKFLSELTNYSNKLTDNSLEEDKMWKLVLLNPMRFFEHLLANASHQDKTQIEIILKVLTEASPVIDEYLINIVMNNLEAAAESSKSQNHVFLAGIFRLSLIDRKEFIRVLLMENLARAMSNDNRSLISMLLNTLRQVSTKLKVEELMSPLTILVAQILDKYRWDLTSFNQQNELIVESSIEIIQDLVKTIITQGNQKDKDWIIAKIKDLKTMTKFYFQKLSLRKGEPVATFDKFLHPLEFEGMPKSKITSFLCETIVRCTSKEFKWLMTNEELKKFVTDALLVVTVIVSKSSNQQGPLNCLHKCVSEYVKAVKVSFISNHLNHNVINIYLIQDLIIPSLEDADKKQQLLTNILKLIKNFPSSSYQELTVLFIDVLKSFKECENFVNEIMDLQDSELKQILMEDSSNCGR